MEAPSPLGTSEWGLKCLLLAGGCSEGWRELRQEVLDIVQLGAAIRCNSPSVCSDLFALEGGFLIALVFILFCSVFIIILNRYPGLVLGTT